MSFVPGRCGPAGRTHPDSAPSTSNRCGAPPRPQPCRRLAAGRHAPIALRVTSPQQSGHDFSLWRADPPTDEAADASEELAMLLPDLRTVATPVLSAQKVLDRLYNAVHGSALEHFGAFYSSELGGIVNSPALMLVHMDDHLVHAAHAVFDTVIIQDGYLYMLPEHVARFKASAAAAGVKLEISDAELQRVVLDTAAASKKLNGIVKFWASAGRGGFGMSSAECASSSIYALATSENTLPIDRTVGWAACTSPIPPKPATIATIKGTNYLPNALAKFHAEEQGMDVGIFVDEEGYILEGPNSNFGMITEDNIFVTPPFDRAVAGITIQRLIQLIPQMHKDYPSDVMVTRVEQRRIHKHEVLRAKEAFLVDTGLLVTAIVSLDGHQISDGQPGNHAMAFANMLENDRLPMEGSMEGFMQHIEVPYGYVTGMRGQLV